jgi:hypothetical protein
MIHILALEIMATMWGVAVASQVHVTKLIQDLW